MEPMIGFDKADTVRRRAAANAAATACRENAIGFQANPQSGDVKAEMAVKFILTDIWALHQQAFSRGWVYGQKKWSQ